MTQWKPISEWEETETLHWILDKDNNIGEGYLKDDSIIVFDMGKTPDEFGAPVMFAEIKPPELPK